MNAHSLYKDDEFAPRPAFPVSYSESYQDTENGVNEVASPPMTAEQYLMQVRYE